MKYEGPGEGETTFKQPSLIRVKNDLFTTETLRIINKINEFSLKTYFRLLTISKVKNKWNDLYLKTEFILSGDINNSESVHSHQIKDHKFNIFNSNGLD